MRYRECVSTNKMATLKQIEANGRNALLSTGPKTAEGKAAVRLNSFNTAFAPKL